MNISNLQLNHTYKNYKQLCEVLEVNPQAGNSKKAQLKELERYCKYYKEGHKFTIKEIYSTPLDKIDNRGKNEGSRGNNNIYGDMIQLLIIDLLAQCKGNISISRSKLMLTINMINYNYSPLNEQVPKLSKYTNIDEKTIYDFYNTSNGNFKSTIETALRKLEDKRIILLEKIIKVCEHETKRHRKATQKERDIIALNEKKILEILGYNEISQIRSSRHWRTFKKKVQKELTSQGKIDYYYHAYDITINQTYIKKEQKKMKNLILRSIKRDEYKGELNATVYYNLIENAQKRHNSGFTSGKMSKVRLNKEYTNHIKRLVNLLIDDSAPYIIDYVKEIEIEDTYKNTSMYELTQEEYEDLLALDDLFA